MFIPRLLFASLLIAAGVAAAVAQAAPDKSPAASAPPFVPPPNWVEACAQLRNHHCVFLRKGSGPSQTTDTAQPSEHDFIITPPPKRPEILVKIEPNDVACFSMRMYRVTRDDPDSDSTRLTGYSTCLPTNRVQLLTSEDSLERAPR